MKFIGFFLLFSLTFSQNIFGVEKCDSYFETQRSNYQQWITEKSLESLAFFLDDLICEAQTKKIPESKTLFFLKSDTPFFMILKKTVQTHQIKDSQLLKTLLILLKQNFEPSILHQILSHYQQKDFSEAFVKASYFYFFIQPKKLNLTNSQLSRLGLNIFKTNPEKSYLESLLNVMLALRNTKKTPERVTEVLEKSINKRYSARKIKQLLEEISN